MSDESNILNKNVDITEVYPPKYLPAETGDTTAVYRSLRSIVLYIGIGYMLFRRFDLLLVLTGIILLHELGHFFAMRYYHYADVSVFFIPVLGAFVKGNKREVSQRQNAVILMAGPLPGIALGIALYFIDKNMGGWYWGDISVYYVAMFLLFLNLFNLLPIFPLDGGQLLNRIFLDEEGTLSNIFVWASAIGIGLFSISSGMYIFLILPVLILLRFINTRKYIDLEKKIINEGIDLDTSYEDLTDEEYWEIRKVIVTNMPVFSDVDAGPPYEYDVKEHKISQEVENILQRNLIQDISFVEKTIVALVWILALASPYIFDIDFGFLKLLFR